MPILSEKSRQLDKQVTNAMQEYTRGIDEACEILNHFLFNGSDREYYIDKTKKFLRRWEMLPKVY